ncbi:hypothetical protein BC833DRAFT_576404 [Globomyces pollinis-pini]|nr:hypothetical protein BC833DRAFT_576404 [Globomyces pollinis-pini]
MQHHTQSDIDVMYESDVKRIDSYKNFRTVQLSNENTFVYQSTQDITTESNAITNKKLLNIRSERNYLSINRSKHIFNNLSRVDFTKTDNEIKSPIETEDSNRVSIPSTTQLNRNTKKSAHTEDIFGAKIQLDEKLVTKVEKELSIVEDPHTVLISSKPLTLSQVRRLIAMSSNFSTPATIETKPMKEEWLRIPDIHLNDVKLDDWEIDNLTLVNPIIHKDDDSIKIFINDKSIEESEVDNLIKNARPLINFQTPIPQICLNDIDLSTEQVDNLINQFAKPHTPQITNLAHYTLIDNRLIPEIQLNDDILSDAELESLIYDPAKKPVNVPQISLNGTLLSSKEIDRLVEFGNSPQLLLLKTKLPPKIKGRIIFNWPPLGERPDTSILPAEIISDTNHAEESRIKRIEDQSDFYFEDEAPRDEIISSKVLKHDQVLKLIAMSSNLPFDQIVPDRKTFTHQTPSKTAKVSSKSILSSNEILIDKSSPHQSSSKTQEATTTEIKSISNDTLIEKEPKAQISMKQQLQKYVEKLSTVFGPANREKTDQTKTTSKNIGDTGPSTDIISMDTIKENDSKLKRPNDQHMSNLLEHLSISFGFNS